VVKHLRKIYRVIEKKVHQVKCLSHLHGMLDSFVLSTVSKWDNTNNCMAMKEGAPADCRLPVRAWLANHFLGRWFGCLGLTKWPPRSPDLTSCDFFFVGVSHRRSTLNKTKKHKMNGSNKFDILLTLLVWTA